MHSCAKRAQGGLYRRFDARQKRPIVVVAALDPAIQSCNCAALDARIKSAHDDLRVCLGHLTRERAHRAAAISARSLCTQWSIARDATRIYRGEPEGGSPRSHGGHGEPNRNCAAPDVQAALFYVSSVPPWCNSYRRYSFFASAAASASASSAGGGVSKNCAVSISGTASPVAWVAASSVDGA